MIGAAYGGAVVGLIAYVAIAGVLPSALWLYVTLWIVLPIGGAVLAASLAGRLIKPATD